MKYFAAGKLNDSEKNQNHFMRHKCHMDGLGANLGLCDEKPAINRLNYRVTRIKRNPNFEKNY
jgi:hypothetical protein